MLVQDFFFSEKGHQSMQRRFSGRSMILFVCLLVSKSSAVTRGFDHCWMKRGRVKAFPGPQLPIIETIIMGI